jgi:dTDP-4-dehydrorhamnose reductase
MMVKRVVVIGANGQLGTDFCSYFVDRGTDYELVRLTRSELDICDASATNNVIAECSPNIVVNTVAYHDVDKCEYHPQEAFDHNAVAVHHLAMACRNVDALLVHFSTDYVFGGKREIGIPLSESAPAKPESVYATSKLAGEYNLRIVGGKHYLVRTSGLYGAAGRRDHGASFVETMLRRVTKGGPIEIVNDQYVSPTATLDLAAKVVELIENTAPYGLYHVTNSGCCTWYQFAEAIFELACIDAELVPVTTKYRERKAKRPTAKRPTYSVLDNSLLSRVGIQPLRPWRAALSEYLHQRCETPQKD